MINSVLKPKKKDHKGPKIVCHQIKSLGDLVIINLHRRSNSIKKALLNSHLERKSPQNWLEGLWRRKKSKKLFNNTKIDIPQKKINNIVKFTF